MKSLLCKIQHEIEWWVTFVFLALMKLMGKGPGAGKIRGFLLRLYGFKFGKGVNIRYNVRLETAKTELVIDEGTGIGENCYFDCAAKITIGKYCDIGFNNVFITALHEMVSDYKTLRPVNKVGEINIEDFVWIGANSIIIGPVRIGRGAVVAAGSVVNKDVPPGTLVAGVPAQIKKIIDSEQD